MIQFLEYMEDYAVWGNNWFSFQKPSLSQLSYARFPGSGLSWYALQYKVIAVRDEHKINPRGIIAI
jgi:hypothetical protein